MNILKTVFLGILMMLALPLFSQKIIECKLTSEHKEIFGSKLSMIPPQHFTKATNFLGFQQEDTNSSIMALDFPSSYDTVAAGLTKENFEKQGLVVNYIEMLTFNNVPALLIKCEQNAHEQIFTKYIFTFGSVSETIMINGVAPKADKILSESIKQALLTTIFNADKILTPLDAVDFKIATINTDFSFSKSMSNMLIYKKEENITTELVDNATFVATKAISKANFTDKKVFALNRLNSLSMQIHTINTTIVVFINGLDGYEFVVHGVNRKTGQPESAYLVILFNDLDYYLLYGSSGKNFELNNASFKRLAQTFQLK